jgi:ribosomal protein S18 acetylase RimI-like enzyme
MGIAEKVKVRFARSDDLAWCVTNDNLVTAEVIKSKIEINEIIVAEVGARIVGYLRLEYLWSTLPYIALIFVQEEYQRRGIGRAILEFVEAFLRGKGYTVLLSSSQVNEPPPQAWHRAIGFEECGILTGISEDGIGEVFFRKSLV